MKIFLTLFLMMALIVPLGGCQKTQTETNIDYWTCSMHPQIHKDEPGNCPICGMTLVPVYKTKPQSQASQPGEPQENAKLTADAMINGVEISAAKQQLIGVKTGFVVNQSMKKVIHTYGRVAFDPELAVAQKEYQEVLRGSPSLRNATRTRLRVLGMSEEEIVALESGKSIAGNYYLPGKADSVWIYALVYEDDMELVKTGMAAHISHSFEPEKSCHGIVRGIDSIIDPKTRALKARIEITTPNVKLSPNMYVDVELTADLGEKLTIPKSAVLDTGLRRLAFVVKGEHFEPRVIETGIGNESDVVVFSGLSAGEKIVTSATFLVDSESQLRGVLSLAK